MRTPASLPRHAVLLLLLVSLASAATSPVPSGAARGTAAGSRTAEGPLPDPVLLDGAGQPAEKRSEIGMLGEFEVPGEENARDGKVGGQSGGASGQTAGPQSAGAAAAGAQSGGLPAMGGASGAGAQAAGGAQAGGAAGAPGSAPGGEQAGGAGGAPGGEPGAVNAGGGPIAGGGDPAAKADGVQVGGLSGDGSPQGAVAGGKPSKVAIGDAAMRIETGPPVPGVVGTQLPPGPVQQHEKGTGSGGKGAAGAGGNRGVERGRSIPSGL